MKEALDKAGIKRYIPTKHAIDRARLRFGIDAGMVGEWINEMMGTAKYIGANGSYTSIYDSDDIRLIIDERTNAVVTVHSAIRAEFLRPTLEREKRKLKRFYTRTIRKIELEYAEALQELAEMAINRARAKNPQTRKLIAERMDSKQEEISDYVSEIERFNDEYKTKVHAIEVIAE